MKAELGQYYTSNNISELLLSNISIPFPRKVVELGVGDGSLVRAALGKWEESELIGCDIDPDNISSLKSEFPSIDLYLLNGLSSNLDKDMKIGLNSIDVAICNPPYLPLKKCEESLAIIRKANLQIDKKIGRITSDLVFLCQNLLFLKEGGELGIILPEGFICSHRFSEVRSSLLGNYHVRAIIELPEKVFKKTEAKTFIAVIKKRKKVNYKVNLFLANKEGDLVGKNRVWKRDVMQRMDFSFHTFDSCSEERDCVKTLNDIGAEIFRGAKSKKELELSKSEFLHTWSLNKELSYKSFNDCSTHAKSAIKGDIVISRVGKRCLGRVLVVESGSVPISDCLYVIRVQEKYRVDVVNSFVSENGQQWVVRYSHGVCARVISKCDLVNFPLSITV